MRAWRNVVIVVTVGVDLLGLTMAAAPGLTARAFSVLIFASPGRIESFVEPAVSYITLAHGVLGAVMAGWATALLALLIGASRYGRREAWWAVAAS